MTHFLSSITAGCAFGLIAAIYLHASIPFTIGFGFLTIAAAICYAGAKIADSIKAKK